MAYRSNGGDAGKHHIYSDGAVYSDDKQGNADNPFVNDQKEQVRQISLEKMDLAKNAESLKDILPNVAIYADGRQRSWEFKKGILNKIVHADGQIWKRKDKKHWDITYKGKLIGKNVEMSNVKIDKEKTLTWTIGGVKKSLSGDGKFHDPTIKSKESLEHKHEPHPEKKADACSYPVKEIAHDIDRLKTGPFINPVESEVKTGLASWYGPGLHGKRTASGSIFNQNEMTAAHKTYAFGTKLLVSYEKSGESVVVKITDRGPYYGNRVLDLSKEAARRLKLIGPGHGKVTYRVVHDSDEKQNLKASL